MPSIGKRCRPAIFALLIVVFAPIVRAQPVGSAFYVATYFDVQPNSTTQGLELIKQYCRASRTGAGNLGADAFQEISRSNRFVVIEVWKDQSSFESHEKAPPRTQFRDMLKAIHGSPYDQRVSHGLAIDPGPAAATDDAIFVVTHVDVPPPAKDGAEALLKRQAEESRKDEGHVRYDVYQQNDPRTNHFTVFAAWKSSTAFDTNEMKAHRVQFREALAPMLGALYDERLYKSLKL